MREELIGRIEAITAEMLGLDGRARAINERLNAIHAGVAVEVAQGRIGESHHQAVIEIALRGHQEFQRLRAEKWEIEKKARLLGAELERLRIEIYSTMTKDLCERMDVLSGCWGFAWRKVT